MKIEVTLILAEKLIGPAIHPVIKSKYGIFAIRSLHPEFEGMTGAVAKMKFFSHWIAIIKIMPVQISLSYRVTCRFSEQGAGGPCGHPASGATPQVINIL